MDQVLSDKDLASFEKDYNSHPEYKLRERTVTKNGINASSINEELQRTLRNSFSVDIDAGKVTNQRHSGRCWMFAGLNVLRVILAKKLNVENIELSQAYLQFYDKIEKANFFFERAIELADEEFNSRLNVFLLDSGIGDGGHFVMFTNLVKKYGVVPYDAMPDLAVSQNTDELNSVLQHLLAQGMRDIRKAHKEGKSTSDLEAIKSKYLDDIYRILTISLGVPPKSFSYDFKDKDKKHVALPNLTPKEFFQQYIETDLDDYVALSDAPIEGREKYVKYTCHFVNNVEGGEPVFFFSVTPEEFKNAALASLEDNTPIWFASDVLTQSLRKEGLLADGLLQRKELFSLDYNMDKKDRLTYRASFCNHAMTFTGVNLTNGKPDRFKVENSWGKENGNDGFFVMSDKWFDEYVYQIFVRRKYVAPEVLAKYDAAKKVEVSPFDTLWATMD